MSSDWLSPAVSAFGEQCADKLHEGAGQPEAAIRGPAETFLATAGDQFGLKVVVHDEAHLKDAGARPDFAIRVNGAITGHVELKKPGENLDPAKFKGHNKRQWERLKDLPNLLYTNGTEWRLYQHGDLAISVRFTGDLHTSGADLECHDLAAESLLRTFLRWAPSPITTVNQLVAEVAPLCRLLRNSVLEQLAAETKALKAGGELYDQPFTVLAEHWRGLLFPTATDDVFADGYAQTITFAFLLARTEGIAVADLESAQIAKKLGVGKPHALMSQALKLLAESATESFKVTLDLMRRVIGAVDWAPIWEKRDDAYIHLYESFLEVYDPALRRKSGVYYTPVEVVQNMVRLTDDVLTTRLGAEQGYLSPSVTTIDPAMGTGTYLHAVIDHAAKRAEELDGPGAVGHVITDLAQRLIGFELQMGSFTVAEMRAVDILKRYGASVPPGGVRLHVTNTLDDPFLEESTVFPGLTALAKSHQQANKIKANTPVTVVIGNPPYLDHAEGLGGWVESGSDNTEFKAPLDRFRKDGNGRVEYVLKNLYIYFWAWATWKVFDAHPKDRHGVVSFITISGYLRGPGFKGMRRYLRETCSEGWIINVTPEKHQPDGPTRVFPGVQQHIAIAIFTRRADTDTTTPADIHYTHVTGRREDKYAQLDALSIDGDAWRTVRTAWDAPFLPAAETAWDDFPALGDLFCWTAPGIKPNRTWVYAPSPNLLQQRWAALTVEEDLEQKKKLFKENDSRRLGAIVDALPSQPKIPGPIGKEAGPCPPPKRIAYRSFDRQWLIPDNRLIDRPRPELWRGDQAPGQLYLTEQHAQPIDSGPAVAFSALIPDMDHFNVRGGRVLPLLHPDGSANLAPGLLNHLSTVLGLPVSVLDVAAYIAGTTAHPAFTEQFADELVTPGIRVPITADPQLWQEAVVLGREVIWTATYGQAFVDPDAGRPKGDISFPAKDTRRPRNLEPIGEGMPEKISYTEGPGGEEDGVLRVGQGTFGPVTPRMWAYDVGGMDVIKKWFSYRKANPGGKKTSPLDDIHLDAWPREWITEFNELLTALRRVTDLEPAQAELLERILAGPLVSTDQLAAGGVKFPQTSKDRKPRYGLAPADTNSDQGTLM